jgi:hypothetical protein
MLIKHHGISKLHTAHTHPSSKSPRKYFQINYEKLQLIRWFALLFYAANQLVAMSQYTIIHSCFFSIAYLTNWGWLLCFIFTFTLLQKRVDENLTQELGNVFHVLLAMQFLITAFYWAVIYPTTVHENYVVLYVDYVKHIFPMMHMFFEFLFNNIMFDRSSLSTFTIFISTYLTTNFTLVHLFGFEIYSMITWQGFLI